MGAPLETNVVLQCTVEASPAAMNTWLVDSGPERDQKLLPTDNKYNMSEFQVNDYTWQMSLSIRALAADDFGDYTCASVNALGSAEDKVRLQKTDAPRPPPSTTPVAAWPAPTTPGTTTTTHHSKQQQHHRPNELRPGRKKQQQQQLKKQQQRKEAEDELRKKAEREKSASARPPPKWSDQDEADTSSAGCRGPRVPLGLDLLLWPLLRLLRHSEL